MNRTKIIVVFFLWFLLLAFIVSAQDSNKIERPSKVILILFDALRADHMSCYGYQRKTTPTIDKIASDGAIFMNNYTQGLNTFFSVPTILYSRYFPPMLHESLDTIECKRAEDENEKLITEIFKKNGYHTIFITTHSWFSDDSPLVKSFDEAILVKSSTDNVPQFGDLNKELFSCLDKNKGNNIFIYIHLVDTHFPHILTPPYDLWVTDDIKSNINEDRRRELAIGSNERDILKPLTPFETDFLNAIYDGSLLYTDQQFSLLMWKLETLNILQDTLIILCADHGELLGEDGMLWGHPPISYDALLRTPLIFYGKGIPKNVSFNGITENVDIVPTIVDLLQLKTSAKFGGISLTPYFIKNKTQQINRPYAFSKCFYLEPESYLNLIEVEKGYESHQMFVITDTKFKLEYHEIDNRYFFWTKNKEDNFIKDKIFANEKKFPVFDLSSESPQEFENAKMYIQTNIIPKYNKYKEKEPDIYYIPFSPFVIPRYVENKDEVISHSGDYEHYTLDNKWGFDTDGFVLWTQPWQENVKPLSFIFNIKQGEYEVYIKSPCNKDFYGHPLSSVKVSLIENEPIIIDKSDCENMEIGYRKVGSTNVDSKNQLHISFEPGNNNIWCNIMGIKLVRKKMESNSESPQKSNNLQKDNATKTDIKKEQKIGLPTEERINQLRQLGYL
ncbi:MAG TPA: sulfatase [Candidatus Hydrogenedens sp.]|nr:sulfatase [Candidatus Hydrogenedens sp.]